jgi:hypothetical protein
MWIFVIVILITFSCNNIKKMELIESPRASKIAPDGTIMMNDGQENARRMKYYNTIQHKSFYKHYQMKKRTK